MTSSKFKRRAAATLGASALTVGGILAATAPAHAFTVPGSTAHVVYCSNNNVNDLIAVGCAEVPGGTSYSAAQAQAQADGHSLLSRTSLGSADTQGAALLLGMLGATGYDMHAPVGLSCTPAQASAFAAPASPAG
jgi:hypothetical protein